MNEYNVTLLQKEDSEHWKEMWEEYMVFYRTSLPVEIMNTTLDRLLSDDPHIGCIVARDSVNVPIGFLNYIIHPSTWTISPECYLQDLYVKPQNRQSGVAKLLVDALKKRAIKHPCSKVYWITQPDNHVAQTFYNQIAKGTAWILFEMTLG